MRLLPSTTIHHLSFLTAKLTSTPSRPPSLCRVARLTARHHPKLIARGGCSGRVPLLLLPTPVVTRGRTAKAYQNPVAHRAHDTQTATACAHSFPAHHLPTTPATSPGSSSTTDRHPRANRRTQRSCSSPHHRFCRFCRGQGCSRTNSPRFVTSIYSENLTCTPFLEAVLT